MGLMFNNGLKMMSGLRDGAVTDDCCCDDGTGGCPLYGQGFDACTFEVLDVWICVTLAGGIYKLPDDSITKIRFMIGSHFQHVSSTPGTIYNLSDFVEDTEPCEIPIDPDPCVTIAVSITYTFATVDTIEIIDQFTVTASDTVSSPFSYTTPPCGANEIIMILHTGGLIHWTSPSPDFTESYTGVVNRAEELTGGLGCNGEVFGTEEEALAFFFQEGACCMGVYRDTTTSDNTPSPSATYGLFPGKFIDGIIPAGWSVDGSLTFTVFRITVIP